MSVVVVASEASIPQQNVGPTMVLTLLLYYSSRERRERRGNKSPKNDPTLMKRNQLNRNQELQFIVKTANMQVTVNLFFRSSSFGFALTSDKEQGKERIYLCPCVSNTSPLSS